MDTQQQKKFNILLIGDTCDDIYTYGHVTRISPEAPVPIFEPHYTINHDGMGGNVRKNLEALGCDVNFLHGAVSKKNRLIDERTKQQLLRIDNDTESKPITFETAIPPVYDAIVISDYNKGSVSYELIEELVKQVNIPIFVDTKKTSINCFSNFKNCIVKCNDNEFSLLKEVPKNINLIVTKGKNGASWNNITFPAPNVEMFDVTGAGDVFLSALSVLYYMTNNMEESIKKSVILASRSTEHLGIYTLAKGDILEVCD